MSLSSALADIISFIIIVILVLSIVVLLSVVVVADVGTALVSILVVTGSIVSSTTS